MTDMLTETFDFSETPIPTDTPPDLAPPSNYDYSCETCGKELFYAGKGRHPRFCDEHKTGGKTRGKGTGGNVVLARQASAVLSQLNGLITLGLMAPVDAIGLPLPETASALASAADGFDEASYNALLTDPALCRAIMRGGGASGKVALLIAYGMLAVAVVPVGMAEHKERRRLSAVFPDADFVK
jgi:hypothetical protein